MINEVIYKDADNTIRIQISDSTGPIKWLDGGVSLMEVYISDLIIDSTSDAVNYDNDGNITLKLGNESYKRINRQIPMKIKVYDPLHSNGQWVLHPDMPKSRMTVKVAE